MFRQRNKQIELKNIVRITKEEEQKTNEILYKENSYPILRIEFTNKQIKKEQFPNKTNEIEFQKILISKKETQ